MKGKRWIGRLLAFCMVIGLMAVMPMPASALEDTYVRVGSTIEYDETTRKVTIADDGTMLVVGRYYTVGADGKSLEAPTTTEPTGKGYIRLSKEGDKYVLTLKDFTYTSKTNNAIAVTFGDCSINIVGSNSVTAGDDSEHATSFALYSAGTLSIEGTGRLSVNGGAVTGRSGFSAGVFTPANCNVKVSNATLLANGGKSSGISGRSEGVRTGNLEMTRGTLMATGGETPNGVSRGIVAWYDVTVSGGVLTATGDTIGLQGNNIKVNGGTVIAETKESDGYYAVYVGTGYKFTGSSGVVMLLGSVRGDIEYSGNYLYQNKDGDWELKGSVTIPRDRKLVIDDGETLVIPNGCTLHNSGTIQNNGTIDVKPGGTLDGNTVGGDGKIIRYWNVTFNANGHGTAPAGLTGVVSGSKIAAPTAPTASGATFAGWYKEAACTNPWDFNTDTVNSNLTLYAKWNTHTHTWSTTYPAENADANKHYHVCTDCNQKDSGEAHEWNCEAATEDSDKHCTICGYVAEPQLAHTHAATKVEAKDPTFTAAGNKEYYTCTCDKWFEDAGCTIEIADHSSVLIPMLEYAFTGGDGGVYTKGSGSTLEFTANGPKDDCTGIRVDGAVIPESNYTLVSGSTIITLKNDYLETLSVGGHTIDVGYGNRSAQAGFTVAAASQGGGTDPDNPNDPDNPDNPDNPNNPNNPDNPGGSTDKPGDTVIQPAKPGSGTVAQNGTPNTGDDNQAALWLGMMLVAGAGIGVLGFRRKKSGSAK